MDRPANPSSTSPSRVLIVGAGVVGMACAMALQREGHEVAVIDPRSPGEGASFGNAGLVASCSVDPIGMPGIVRRAPAMLFDRMGPLVVRWSYLPRIAPWLCRFVAASRPARVERISIALASLVGGAVKTWAALIRGTPAEQYLSYRGWIQGFETDA